MTKHLSFITAGFIATLASAQATPTPTFHSGFTGGIHMGMVQNKVKFNDTYYTGTAINVYLNDRTTTRFSNFFGGVSLGYQHIFKNRWTAAFNLQADKFDNETVVIKTTSAGSKSTYKRHYTLMPELLMGYVFHPRWHGAIGLGVPFTRFKGEFESNQGPRNQARTKAGFMTSAHVNYAVTDRLAVNLALGHEWYNNFTTTIGSDFRNVPGSQYQAKAHIRSWTGQIGVSYRF